MRLLKKLVAELAPLGGEEMLEMRADGSVRRQVVRFGWGQSAYCETRGGYTTPTGPAGVLLRECWEALPKKDFGTPGHCPAVAAPALVAALRNQVTE